ncbi:MAG TPA: VTT domain-containing protein [Candidatus Dormibacteraeota bacterium]|nr:VTT domain-containing protein [Candidatus Dormibacteraeota bacterium]
MTFLQGLHGGIAVALLALLLFVDECGVPLPFAPSEVLLIAGGVLMATGAVSPWVFLPAATLAMAAGMVTGYSWARTLGGAGLRALADRIGAADALGRTARRLRAAGPAGIAVARLIPGIRPYATLVSGAAGVPLTTFLAGALPALLVWLVALTGVGTLVGLPAAHLLGRLEEVVLRGAALILLALVAWVAGRRLGAAGAAGRLPPRTRRLLGAGIDAGAVAALVAGCLALGRRLLDLSGRGWIDGLAVAAVVAALAGLRRHRARAGPRVNPVHG